MKFEKPYVIYNAMTRSFIISFALVAMSAVSGFALSTVHNQTVVSHAPILTEPRPLETKSGFVIPEFVPATTSQMAPAPLDLVATPSEAPVVMLEEPAAEVKINDEVLSPEASLRPQARINEIVVTIPHQPTPAALPARQPLKVAAPKAPKQVISTQSSARPMIVAQVPRRSIAISPDYLVGVYR